MNVANFPFLNQTPANQSSQKYQILYNQTAALKKDYDTTTDTEMKNALKIVLNKKIEELQNITTVHTSAMNAQIQALVPQ